MISSRHPDQRSLCLAQAIVQKVEADPARSALFRAQELCRRWLEKEWQADLAEWAQVLGQGWEAARRVLLSTDEQGRRLRQSNPFCGVLSPRERWAVLKKTGAA